MNFKKIKNLALDGLVKQNPTFKLVLGTCPTLALTTAATSSFGMGIAVTAVLIFSNIIISLLRNIIPDKVRIPCFIVIIATFVTIVELAMNKFLPDLYDSLGVFLPLIVVNCLILGRAEAFASKNPVLDSAFDGLFMGLGFTAALTLMGIVRELLSSASIFGIQLWDPTVFSIKFFGSSAGAFLTYGVFIALFTVCYNAIQNKARRASAQKALAKEAE